MVRFPQRSLQSAGPILMAAEQTMHTGVSPSFSGRKESVQHKQNSKHKRLMNANRY